MWAQDGPKMATRRPKTAQDGATMVQGGRGCPELDPRVTPSRGFKLIEDVSPNFFEKVLFASCFPEGPKRARRVPRGAQDELKLGPKWPQDGPRWAE